jgi:hypothetical protein
MQPHAQREQRGDHMRALAKDRYDMKLLKGSLPIPLMCASHLPPFRRPTATRQRQPRRLCQTVQRSPGASDLLSGRAPPDLTGGGSIMPRDGNPCNELFAKHRSHPRSAGARTLRESTELAVPAAQATRRVSVIRCRQRKFAAARDRSSATMSLRFQMMRNHQLQRVSILEVTGCPSCRAPGAHRCRVAPALFG